MLNLTERNGVRPGRQPSSGLVLLAEDQPVNQRVAATMLGHLGFRVDVVSDGAEAVKAATATPYHAILMDIQIPVLDGYQATGEIRRLQGGSLRTPIIAVTASSMKADQERGLEAGMDDYLMKPLSLKALATVLSLWAPDGSELAIADPGADLLPSHVDLTRVSSPTRPVLDTLIIGRLERLGEAAGEDLIGQLAALFLAYADAGVVALRGALEGDDAAAVVRSAHTLHGSSANIGATHMARLCATLEEHGGDGDLTGGKGLLEAIEAELARVRSALGSLAPTP